jgi:hypothetical protein
LFENPSFLVKIRFYNSIFAFTSIAAPHMEYARIGKQLANVRECVFTFRVQGTIRHRVRTLVPIESRTPGFAQLYVFDGDMEAQ